MLTEKQITEFQALCKNRFGYELPRDLAIESATRLLNIMRVLLKPNPTNTYEQNK